MAVAAELKKAYPDAKIVYIGKYGDRFSRVVRNHPAIDGVKLIFAGKFRRYHGEGAKQMLDLKTMFFNLRDAVLVVLGILQSLWHIGIIRPDVVFVKGGFVSVPVGLATAAWRIPFVTHDSDALAGLANRIIARWARYHAVALPAEQYEYLREKTFTVGVPITQEYTFVDESTQREYKKQLGIPSSAMVLLITGGGLGARLLNDAAVIIAKDLLSRYKNLHIVHTTGHKPYKTVRQMYNETIPKNQQGRMHVVDYTSRLHLYSGAADVVVSRAGATNMAELAAQGRAAIIVPNPVLAGGHQLKNAAAYEKASAVVVVHEDDVRQRPEVLKAAIVDLLDFPDKRKKLGTALHTFAHDHSAQELATLLVSARRGAE